MDKICKMITNLNNINGLFLFFEKKSEYFFTSEAEGM